MSLGAAGAEAAGAADEEPVMLTGVTIGDRRST